MQVFVGKGVRISKRDGGLEWIRGVADSCKRMGGWKKWRLGETPLITWGRGGFCPAGGRGRLMLVLCSV